MRWVVTSIIGAFLVLSIWTVYANVLSDDTSLRARADSMARATLGCGSGCRLVRAEGSRGVFAQQIAYRFTRGRVTITCKRPYIAFGAYVCEASKPEAP